MFFFFFYSCFSAFKPINDDEFDDYVLSSMLSPILAGFYRGNNSLSKILTQRMEELGKHVENDFVTTVVNCSESVELCQNLSIKKIPSIILFNTPDFKFRTEYDGLLTVPDMLNFVEESTARARKTFSGFQETDFVHRENSFAVCSTSVVESIQIGLEMMLPAFGHKLYYTKSPKQFLKIYTGKNCIRKYSGAHRYKKMLDFIYNNRFSQTHQFTYREIIDYNPSVPLVLLASRGKITEGQIDILSNLSAAYCNDYNFGWTNVNADKRAESMLHIEDHEPSTFVYIDRANKVVYKMMKPFTIFNSKQFVMNITTNSVLNDRETDPKWVIVLAFFVIASICIFKVRFNKNYEKIMNWITKIQIPWWLCTRYRRFRL